MNKTIYVVLAWALAGCATPNSSQFSAEQLKAIAADKNFTAVCSKIQGPWGTGTFVYSNVDRSVVINGEITVDANCVVMMSNTESAKKAAPNPQAPTPQVVPSR